MSNLVSLYTVKKIQIEEEVVERRRLGRHVHHDSRSKQFPYTARRDVPLHNVAHSRRIGPLDQGALGSCVGNAGAGLLATEPYAATLEKLLPSSSISEAFAVALYSDTTKIDPYSGDYPPDDTGTDGLSMAKVLKSRKLISGYEWAFTFEAALQALMDRPVATGVNWYEGFDEPDDTGLVKISGQVRGGHEFEIEQYEDGYVWFTNSWGNYWGKNGRARMHVDTWRQLLDEDGDVTVLTPLTEPAPTPTPVPAAPADATYVAQMDNWLSGSPFFYKRSVQRWYRDWKAARGL